MRGAALAAIIDRRRNRHALAGPFGDTNYWAGPLNQGPVGPNQTIAFAGVFASSNAGAEVMLTRITAGATIGWQLYVTGASNVMRFFVAPSAVQFSFPAIGNGVPFVIAIGHDGTNLRGCMNAGVVNTIAAGTYTAADSTTQLIAGRNTTAGAPFIRGSLAGWKAWNRCITDAELQAVSATASSYAIGTTGDELEDFNVARDARPGAGTSTTQGSSPLVLTLNGSIAITPV